MLKGRCSAETASSLANPMTWVILNVKSFPNFFTNFIAVVRYLIAKDGAGGDVHDEPDIGFDSADFYVDFIGSEDISFFVVIQIHKRLNANSGGLTVIGDLLMGDADVIQSFEGLRSLAQGKPEVYM